MAAWICVVVLGWVRHYLDKHIHEGVIITPEVTLRAAPDQQSAEVERLHAGLKVTLIDTLSVKDNENGLLVPAGDADAMANAINKLIADPELRLRLGQRARETAVKNHSWEQYFSQLETVFESVKNTSMSHNR